MFIFNHVSVVGEGKWLPSTLLRSLAGLQIKLTQDRLTEKNIGIKTLDKQQVQKKVIWTLVLFLKSRRRNSHVKDTCPVLVEKAAVLSSRMRS